MEKVNEKGTKKKIIDVENTLFVHQINIFTTKAQTEKKIWKNKKENSFKRKNYLFHLAIRKENKCRTLFHVERKYLQI